MPDTITTAEPPPPQPETLLLNRRRTAESIGLSLRTFERIEAEGNGPPRLMLRGQWWYRPEDVRSWLAGQVRRPR